MTATAPISYAGVIRDALLSRFRTYPFFADFKKFGRSRQMVVQPDQVPYAGCYFINEILNPDGDHNAGDISFKHFVRIGFSIVIQNNNPDQTEYTLDLAYNVLMNGLLRDPTMFGFYNTTLDQGVAIEGVTRGQRQHVYGTAGKDNELPIGELQFDLTVTFRSDWPAYVTDDLDLIHVTTGFPLGGTEEERAGVLQVVSNYDLTTEEEP